MIPVVTDLPAYRVASAELSSSTRVLGGSDPEPVGAVVVVAGMGAWVAEARRAAVAGAAAIVVAQPGGVTRAELDELAAAAVPLVLERARLRTDALGADAVVPAARYRTAEVAAAPKALRPAVRDAIGWLRTLSGGALTLTDVAWTATGVLARLVADRDGRQALLTGSTLVGTAAGSRIRVHSVGDDRLEVTVDEAAGVRIVEAGSAAGTLRMPRVHEASARVALRRAVAAARGETAVTDLADFAHDHALATAIFAGRHG